MAAIQCIHTQATDDNGFYRKDGEDHVVTAFYHIFLFDFWKDDWLCI
jgi:hypothetical protein